MDSNKIKIARYGVMLATKIRIIRPFIFNCIKSIPFILVIWCIEHTTIEILSLDIFQDLKDPQTLLSIISIYFGGGAILIAIVQMYIGFLQPNYSKDIKELLIINNNLLILKESGLLDEKELIKLLKANQEIYTEQKITNKDNNKISKMLDNYDKVLKEKDILDKQEEIKKKILNGN